MTATDIDRSIDKGTRAEQNSASGWRYLRELIVGPNEPPAGPPARLTFLTVVLIGATLAVWRGAIALASVAWGRLGVEEPWPPGIDTMWLWKYSVRWDSGWYLTIAREGYEHVPDGQSPIAFFPLLPSGIRLADQILPGTDVLAGLVVVHLALFGALIYIYQLVRIDFPRIVAWRTIFFTLIFPASFFFSALYTESLLLLGFAGALYHARRGQWLLAGVFGFFAGLTKLIGLILIIPVGLELIRQHAATSRNPMPLVYGALIPSGSILYLGNLQVRYGDFRVYFEAQAYWLREAFNPEPFSLLLRELTGNAPVLYPYPANTTTLHSLFVVIDVGILLLFLAAGVYLWLRVRPSYGALVLAGALIPALSGTPLAMTRYMAILFPVFLLLGRIESEAVRNSLAIVSSLGLVFTAFLFVNGYWAG